MLSINALILIHTVSPVCLPWDQPSTEFTGRTGVTVGWGTTEDGDTSDTLRKVTSNFQIVIDSPKDIIRFLSNGVSQINI